MESEIIFGKCLNLLSLQGQDEDNTKENFQNSLKNKLKSKNSLKVYSKHKTNNSLNNFIFANKRFDLVQYISNRNTESNLNSNQKTTAVNSNSSTLDKQLGLNSNFKIAIPFKITETKENELTRDFIVPNDNSQITFYDSFISRQTSKVNPNKTLNETIYYSIAEDSFISQRSFVQEFEGKSVAGDNIEEDIGIISEFDGVKTFSENPFIIHGKFGNKDYIEEEYIYDNCIKILRFLSEGAQAKIYLGLIEEIDKYVAIKRYLISYNENEINKIMSECDIVKNLEHPNIIKYFDIEVTNIVTEHQNINVDTFDDKEINIENNIISSKIDIIMEFMDGMNLKDYLIRNFSKGIPMEDVKLITQKILEGLAYLHSNKIIHRDLKPENVLIGEEFCEIKIVDFGICTKVKDCETFKKRTVLGTPYYMAPEVISEKPYAYEADIWSLGCIVYELVCGTKPYADMNPYNAMYKMVQYTSPLEYADDNIKDIFYDKTNRNLLDFLQKCWRPNNSFRPTANELLDHNFLKIK